MSITIKGDNVEVNMSKVEFRKKAVDKFLSRGDRPASEVAKEVGVTIKTLYLWVDRYALFNDVVKRNPSTIQKLKLIIQYDAFSDLEKGKLLRQHGLYSEQLERWREQVMKKDLEKITEKTLQNIMEAQKEKIKELEKELKRKDKALAEANAVILLQKKAEELFSEEDEE